MKRRFLSLFLAFAMLYTAVPCMVACAAATDNQNDLFIDKYSFDNLASSSVTYDLNLDGQADTLSISRYNIYSESMGAYCARYEFIINGYSYFITDTREAICDEIYITDIDQNDNYLDIVTIWTYKYIDAEIFRFDGSTLLKLNNGDYDDYDVFEVWSNTAYWDARLASSNGVLENFPAVNLYVEGSTSGSARFAFTCGDETYVYKKVSDFEYTSDNTSTDPTKWGQQETETTTPTAYGNEVGVYAEVIERYQKAQANSFYKNDRDMVSIEDINAELMLSAYDDSELYYTLIDLSQDGTPELLIAAKSGSTNGYYPVDYIIYDTFGYENGVVSRLFDTYSMGYRSNYFIMTGNVIAVYGSGGSRNNGVEYYTLPANSTTPVLTQMLMYDGYSGTDVYTKTVDGIETTITKTEYDNIIASYEYLDIEWIPLSSYVGISVLLNGVELSFDQPPIMINDRTMVPIRAIFEAMGYTVNWNDDTQTATATKGTDKIVVQIGNSTISYVTDGKSGTYECDTVPQIVNDRTLVPVRAIAESAGCTVDWNEDTQTVVITTNTTNSVTIETTDSYNYSKILDGDFSDFTGFWTSPEGYTKLILRNGLQEGDEEISHSIYSIMYNDDGSYSWTIEATYYDGSPSEYYTLRLYPIGIEVTLSSGEIVETDVSRLRLCVWSENIGSNDIYYKQ